VGILKKETGGWSALFVFLFCLFLIVSNAFAVDQGSPATQPQAPVDFNPTRLQLDTVRQWLWQNPPDGHNRQERRKRMAVIQTACDQLEPQIFWTYCDGQTKNNSPRIEDSYPAIYYLYKADQNAFENIHKTQVKKGLAVWYLYNMGYVFKTPESCFGIDISAVNSERLAGDLDFLLTTHDHGDHFWVPLLDSMIKAGKPVVTLWYKGSKVVTKPTQFKFGHVRVKVDIGDHHREDADGKDNMLMYQVDCPIGDGTCTIYHSGDGNNYLKMHPDRKVDIYIPHVQVGMSIEDAVHYLKPQITLVSHVMELGHSPKPPHAWRWSFDYAFDIVKNIPESQATILTWGERWLLPGTILEP